ncbi:MAG: EamA family transporter [Chloroflexi bacterium]|nr:MAG: EamA family transporter [Chloroflexota bacterium]
MIYLFVVSLIWAFSFGLIKGQLTGLDANFVAAARLVISLAVFLPFLRLRNVPGRLRLRLILTGAVQYGLMYIAYTYAFQYLQAYEVALFTIFTPLYVTLINDAYQHRFHPISLAATVLAVAGTTVVKEGNLLRPELLTGFLVVQVSNLAFAFGQVDYKETLKKYPDLSDTRIFGLLYLGGALAAGLPAVFTTPWQTMALTGSQLLTLIYLGAVASGVCFFMWNVGARKVHTGTLAVFNDLKIPLAVTVSLVFFGEKASLPHLLIGGLIVLAALLMNEWGAKRAAARSQAMESAV